MPDDLEQINLAIAEKAGWTDIKVWDEKAIQVAKTQSPESQVLEVEFA